MLVRTFLLLLCVSSSLAATLGLFHMQAKDEDTPPQDTVLDNTVEAVIENLQEKEADDKPKETPQHEEEKILDNGNDKQPEDDIAVQAVAVEDAAPAEEVAKVQAVDVEDAAPAEEVAKVQAVDVEDAAPAEEAAKVQSVDVEDGAPAEEVAKVQSVDVEDAAPAEEVAKVQAVDVGDAAPAEEVAKVQSVDVEDAAPAEEVAKEQAVDVGDAAPAEDVVETDSDKKSDEENVVEQLPQTEDNEIKPVQTKEVPKPEETSRWGLNSIRSGFQNMNGYFDSLVELVGGRNGVCQYRCRYGHIPAPRPGYQLPEPNGCSSSLVGFQLDLGIPAMTQCCNQLDLCYDSCGTSKYDCDTSFRTCLHGICSDLKKSLGLGTQYQACESMGDGLFNTVWTLGCRPYMNSQRAACICEEEDKDEL